MNTKQNIVSEVKNSNRDTLDFREQVLQAKSRGTIFLTLVYTETRYKNVKSKDGEKIGVKPYKVVIGKQKMPISSKVYGGRTVDELKELFKEIANDKCANHFEIS